MKKIEEEEKKLLEDMVNEERKSEQIDSSLPVEDPHLKAPKKKKKKVSQNKSEPE